MVKCIKCDKNVTKKCPGIQCNNCKKWLHGTCASITTEQLSALSLTESVDWKCRSCVGGARPKRLSCIVPDLEEDDNTDANIETGSKNAIFQEITRDLRREIREIIRKELQTTLQFYSDKIDDYEKKIHTFENTTKSLEKQVLDVKNKCKNIDTKYQALEQKMYATEQSRLANSLEICGVEETEGEDVHKITNDLASMLQQNPNDIIEATRKKTRTRDSQNPTSKKNHPTITVQLRNGSRDQWLEAAKSISINPVDLGLSGNSKIYTREQLTPFNSYLLWKAKSELKSTNLCKFVWPKNGLILVRRADKEKYTIVRSIQDIEDLSSRYKTENAPTNSSE